MNALRSAFLRWRLPVAGLALVAAFAVLAGRFWHPYYGFTRFVQLDAGDHRTGIHELREYPVFSYPEFSGYDGTAYVQLAFHPLLDAPELKPAVDNLAYRARRILGSALAWVLAGGQPERIASTYAALNLFVWLGFAGLLWRVLPVTDARSGVAWAGVLLSAGALHSVRLALTDLLATTLVTAALWLGERNRGRSALGLLAAAGLARETALTAIVAFWRSPWLSPRAWLGNGVRTVLAALPLLAWMLYVRWKTGPSDPGLGNLAWPFVAWFEKWSETAADYVRHPDFHLLITTTLFATIALTVQAAYLVMRPRWHDRWWRAGIGGVVLMALLGTAVWEGHPGAATRVLLPMGVAFAVLAVRNRAGWAWIVGGSLSVASGLLAFRDVPYDDREIEAGRFAGGAYVVQIESGWFGTERQGRVVWAWAPNRGMLFFQTAPRSSSPCRVRLKLETLAPRNLEVWHAGSVIFRGTLVPKLAWIDLPPVAPETPGEFRLELRSSGALVPESPQPGARGLGFALRGVEVR